MSDDSINFNTTSDDEVIPQVDTQLSSQRCRKRKQGSSIGRNFRKRKKNKMKYILKCSSAPSSLGSPPPPPLPPPPLAPPPLDSPSQILAPHQSTPTTQSSSTLTTLSSSSSPPQIATPIQCGPQGKRMSVEEAVKLRIAIEMIFWLKYYKSFSPENLNGPNCIVQNICHDLGYTHPMTVRKVVLDVHKAIEEEKEYNALKKKFELEGRRKIKKAHTNITF